MRTQLGDPYFELTRTKCKALQQDPVVVSERCVYAFVAVVFVLGCTWLLFDLLLMKHQPACWQTSASALILLHHTLTLLVSNQL